VREKESSNKRKEEAKEQEGSSTWILKSPVIKISEEEEARSSRSVVKSVRKVLQEEEGGRYTERRIKEIGLVEEHEELKVLNNGRKGTQKMKK